MAKPDLSVIIVSYNTRDLLRDCLNSLRRVQDEACLEIVVVDNASADGSAEMVRMDFPEIRLIQSTINLGFAAGMNRGIAAASAELLLALNPDTVMVRRTISKLLKFMEEHPKAAIAGAGLTFSDGTPQPSTFGFPSLFKEFWNAFPELKYFFKVRKIRDVLHYRALNPTTPAAYQVECVSGAALVARRAAVREVEEFDEGFFLYHEERDLCLRLRSAGWEIWSIPAAQVIHFDAKASGYEQSRLPGMPVLEWRTLGMDRLWAKHKSKSAHRLWMCQTRFLFRVRVLFLGVGGLLSGAAGRARLGKRQADLRRVVTLLGRERGGIVEPKSPQKQEDA
jgi:GT2 family glycosyltransferase